MLYRDLLLSLRPVGYWPLDDAAGPMRERSRRTASADGTLNGTTAPAGGRFVDGRRVLDVSFGGYVQVTDNNAWSITTTSRLSAVVWAKLDARDTVGNTLIAKRGQLGQSFEYILRSLASDDSLNAQLTDSAGADMADASSSLIPVGVDKWFMLAFTADDNIDQLFVYVNGVKVASDTVWSGTAANQASDLHFGWWAPSGDASQQHDGLLAEAAMFNYVLSPALIARLWAVGRHRGRVRARAL